MGFPQGSIFHLGNEKTKCFRTLSGMLVMAPQPLPVIGCTALMSQTGKQKGHHQFEHPHPKDLRLPLAPFLKFWSPGKEEARVERKVGRGMKGNRAGEPSQTEASFE